jgi:glycosyltransferase involved in cell wall biosynthesis
MHIGYICNEYPGIGPNGGIGSFVQGLGTQLIAQGHSVSVFGVYKNLKRKIVISDHGVKVIGIPYVYVPKVHWELNRIRLMKLLKHEYKKNSLSLVEAPDYQGWLRALKLDIPKIVRIHSPQKYGLDPSIEPGNPTRTIRSEEKSILHADFVCACGKSVADAARKTYVNSLSEKTPIEVIYNGINTDFYRPFTIRDFASVNIVFVGRLTVKKGVVELIKAWITIVKEFPEAKLILVGRDSEFGKSKSMINELKQIIPENIRETVIFKGFLNSSELLQLFQYTTLCIFPSHREAFSVVILEAMSSGKPVIYSKIGAGFEVIDDGYTGILCDPHNPDDIADKAIYLLKNKGIMNIIGQNARKHIVDNFSLPNITERNLEYYRYCVQKY